MAIKPTQFDKAFSRLLARRGLLSTDEIYKIARIAVTRRDIGEPCTMADVCRELMFLDPPLIEELVRQIRIVTFVCDNTECGTQNRVLVYDNEDPGFTCRKCNKGQLVPQGEGEVAEPLVSRETLGRASARPKPRLPRGTKKDTTRKVESERRKPRSMTRRLSPQSETGLVVQPDDATRRATLAAGEIAPGNATDSDTETPTSLSPAPLPGSQRVRSDRTTSVGPPAPAPAAAPIGDSPARMPDEPLGDLPDLRGPEERGAMPSDVWFETGSTTPSEGEQSTQLNVVDDAALEELSGDDAYAGAHPRAARVRAAMGFEAALLDDHYDSFGTLVALITGSEPAMVGAFVGSGDSAVIDYDDIGLVDIAAVEAEVAAEKSEFDSQVDMSGGIKTPAPVDVDDDVPDDDEFDDFNDFDFDDDEAFSAALSEAIQDEGDEVDPRQSESTMASKEDLLAAIDEVEKAFTSGNVEKRSAPTADPWGSERTFSVNVASPHLDTFSPPTQSDSLLELEGGPGSGPVQLPTLNASDVADPLASSLEVPPPVNETRPDHGAGTADGEDDRGPAAPTSDDDGSDRVDDDK